VPPSEGKACRCPGRGDIPNAAWRASSCAASRHPVGVTGSGREAFEGPEQVEKGSFAQDRQQERGESRSSARPPASAERPARRPSKGRLPLASVKPPCEHFWRRGPPSRGILSGPGRSPPRRCERGSQYAVQRSILPGLPRPIGAPLRISRIRTEYSSSVGKRPPGVQ
jgi:hypothetical protein